MKIYNYKLYLMGIKEPLIMTQTQGQKLAIMLMQPNCPKFVLIDNDVISVNCINSLQQANNEIRSNKFGVTETFDIGIEVEKLTDVDVEINKKYHFLKEGFIKKLN